MLTNKHMSNSVLYQQAQTNWNLEQTFFAAFQKINNFAKIKPKISLSLN